MSHKDKVLVESIRSSLDDSFLAKMSADNFTICQVPGRIRKDKQIFYEPSFVSIGPYHHAKPHLSAMQKHKLWHLHNFLERNPSNTLETYVQALKSLEFRARTCYFQETKLSSDEFVEMMLLDGCFIIEFLLNYFSESTQCIRPITWFMDQIWQDFLLLENQIPFFVLQGLFNLQAPNPSMSLVRMASNFIVESPKLSDSVESCPRSETVQHLLHLYHHYTVVGFVPSTSAPRNFMCTNFECVRPILCAKQLVKAGVKLKKRTSERYMNVTFEKGVLAIPTFVIDASKRSRMMNLVAFEQCNSKVRIFTAYTQFLSSLIDDSKDLEILERYGIIVSEINWTDALIFFKQLYEYAYVDLQDNYLIDVYARINEFCKSNWTKYRTPLFVDVLRSICY